MRGCTDLNPEPSDRLSDAFTTKPAAFLDADSCDDSILSIGPHWDIYIQDT